MIPVNYHHLYYFWVTAKAGSITQAREKLLLAQPTLSLQIRQLERFFGKRLLRRGRQGVALTPEGRMAFEYCERIFSEGDALVAALSRGGAALPPVLRVGASKAISREILLELLDAVQRMDRRVRPTIFGGALPELRERLERHQLDVVVSDRDFAAPMGREFRGRLVGTLPVHFAAAPKLRAELGRFPTAGQEVQALVRSPENSVRKEVEEFLTRRRVRFSIAAESEDADLIRILAVRGLGIAALNALTVRDDLAEGRLVRLQAGPSGIKEYVWLSCSIHPSPVPAVQQVLQGLMARFKVRAG